MPAPSRVPTGLIGATAAAMIAVPAFGALASDAVLRFDIAAAPLPSALLDFAIQARVSISTGAAADCRRAANPLIGRFALADGLNRLLAGTGCGYRMSGDGAIIIFRAREPMAVATHGAPPGGRQPGLGVQEVVVTAARRTALVDRAPYSVSVVPGADMAAAGASDLSGFGPQIAGVGMTDLGPGRDKLFIRGLSDSPLTGNAQSTVGVYVDGSRITYNAPDPDLRLVDVERVEVLRGPQGALYGAGSIGGMVHIVTRKPVLDAFSGSLGAGVSATRGGAPSRSIDTVLNLPVIPGVLAIRAAAYDERQGGYIDDVRLGVRDANSMTRRGVRAAVRWQATPDWTVTANVTRQSLNSADTHYAEPSVGARARDTYLREPHDNDFLAASVELAGNQDWGALTATTSVMSHQYDSRYDATLALPFFAPSAPVAASPFDESNRSELLVNEVSAASPDAGRLRWLAGLFQSLGDDDSTSTLTAPLGPGGQASSVYRESRYDLMRELAAYGQASYLVTPQLTLSLGGRWFHESVKTRSHVVEQLNGGANGFTGKTATSGFAPQAVVRYQPAGDVTVYAQASEGYRAAGFNTAGPSGQVFAPDVAGPQPQRLYAGDELWNYEAGAKIGLFQGAVKIRTAAFYMLWKNVQSDQLLANGLAYTANIGDGRDIGWEVEADIQPDAHWRFKGAMTVAEPELIRPNPAFVSRPDNGLPGAPRFSASALASYQWSVSPSVDVRLQGGYAYVGPSHLTLDATTSTPMGDYSTARLSGAVLHDRWTATAFLAAPLGGRGDTFGYGDPFSFRSIAQSTPARPVTVGLDLGVRFP